MILTEEQLEALDFALEYLVDDPNDDRDSNLANSIRTIRAMINSSKHVIDPTKMIGFDLERARGLRDFLQDDCAEVGDVWAEMIAEIERLRASLIDLHAEYINTLEKNPECSAWDLDEQSDADQRRLRRNAAHAISIVEPPIYLQAEQQATKIRELKADLEQAERVIEARLEVIDQQAARIKELEADNQNLVTLNKSLMNNDWILRDNNRKYRKRAQKAELLNKELKSKIGPDARPKCDHAWQAAIEERGYQTCLKCGECRDIKDIPRTPAWQITEDRVTAIDQGLRFLEWSNAKNGSVETKKHIATLQTMLEETSDEHGFER